MNSCNERIQNSEFDRAIMEIRTASKSFQDLVVWQKAHAFVLETYSYTNNFPKTEIYALTSQYRRAAISIPANIAEGFNKKGKADKCRFFNIAQGSLEECRYYCILANDLNYGDTTSMIEKVEEISKLLEAYIRKILDSDS